MREQTIIKEQLLSSEPILLSGAVKSLRDQEELASLTREFWEGFHLPSLSTLQNQHRDHPTRGVYLQPQTKEHPISGENKVGPRPRAVTDSRYKQLMGFSFQSFTDFPLNGVSLAGALNSTSLPI